MSKHLVKVTQVFRVQKEILVEVEADSVEEAVEIQQEADAPDFSDPNWKTESCTLEHEQVEPA